MEEERRRACLEGAAVPPIALAGTGIPDETSLEKVPSEIFATALTVYLIQGKLRSIDDMVFASSSGGREKTRLFGGGGGRGGGETEKTARRRSESFEYGNHQQISFFPIHFSVTIFLPFYALIVCVQRVEEERRRACLDQVLPRHQCPRCQRCDVTGSV